MQEKLQLPLTSLFSICVEYNALISGLRFCVSRQIDVVSICCSSEIICQQLQGNQMRHLSSVSHVSRELLSTAFELLNMFKLYNLNYIRNEENIAKYI
jgi:ribonuclease HI